MYKKKIFAFVADPTFKQPVVYKSFEHVSDPTYKPKYRKHKSKVAVDIIRAVSSLPPPEGDRMRSLSEGIDISCMPVVSRTPSSSSLVCEPVVPKPAPAPVPERVRVVPEAPKVIPKVYSVAPKPALAPKPVPKPVPAPAPAPAPAPESVLEPVRPPSPVHPVGSRAWRISQFIKANFK
jgi:hypothetical protein